MPGEQRNISGIDENKADALLREISQIANAPAGFKKAGRQVAGAVAAAKTVKDKVQGLQEKYLSKQVSGYSGDGENSGDNPEGEGAATETPEAPPRSDAPPVSYSSVTAAEQFHDINSRFGEQGTDGSTTWKGANYTVRSTSPSDVKVTRPDNSVALNVEQGKTTQNTLTKTELSGLNKAHKKTIPTKSQTKGKTKPTNGKDMGGRGV